MSSTVARFVGRDLPPDQGARTHALNASRSVLVQAPAGSGKTGLLTRRFLRLLGEVDDPAQIVAITFTKAAAAEMRHRILGELENAAARPENEKQKNAELDEFSPQALAERVLECSRARGWNLTELPAQLRVMTIDAFCRELALQQPLLSELGGGLDILAQPDELYRRAARRTLEQIDLAEPELRAAIESLLLWRDNGWQDMEALLMKMLAQRDRWLQDFVLEGRPDWDAVREHLERPFARGVRDKMLELAALLDQVPQARAEALQLARFACDQTAGALFRELAELAEFPVAPFADAEQLEEARQACACLADLLLTQDGAFRQRVDKSMGFPADRKAEKSRLIALIAEVREIDGLKDALAAVGDLPPARYTEDDWQIVRACFRLLRHAAGELKVVFAEQGAVDYAEVAQIALKVLKGDEDGPGETVQAAADGIRHLLVDEFQDTSRRQHQLLARLMAAWPDRDGRTCFVVGDPMQSIYFFRDADAELFPLVRENGFAIADDEPLFFDSVSLTANFRTARNLVDEVNAFFANVFARDDGSGVSFTASVPARNEDTGPRKQETQTGAQAVGGEQPLLKLHLNFTPKKTASGAAAEEKERIEQQRNEAHAEQVQEIVELIRSHRSRLNAARAEGKAYRIAVLGRARKALAPIAVALREAGIPFAAIDLEKLKDRPEVLDALALVRALLNPHDRIAWLGVLRAPWSGLSLADLHLLVSADDPELQSRPVPDLVLEREDLLSVEGRIAVRRVMGAFEAARAWRAAQPTAALGTWVEHAWFGLGGAACVNAEARANLLLLWKCLDDLADGEQGVSGSALDRALDKLTALPDPEVESYWGVQLMTIHGAKGLEFEVVIVLELQARSGRTHGDLLAWMERGLAKPELGEVTEFLVAPIPPRGAGRGKAKAWVDRIRREKEAQEMRRLLYVAMTRAREEIHLFARPSYKREGESLELVEPMDCLLATAWPAFNEKVWREFEQWIRTAAPGVAETIAAGDRNLLVMPDSTTNSVIVRRLPAEYESSPSAAAEPDAAMVFSNAAGQLYRRHEGGLISRVLGVAVHRLLEELARLRLTMNWEDARGVLASIEPRIASAVRGSGIERGQAARIAAQALEIALRASDEPVGQWILSPHAAAASEARWAGVVGNSVRAVQVDRVFRGGLQPLADGNETWWIVDYKTAHAEGLDPRNVLPELRELFAPQLETYAQMLRNLHGTGARVCAGLYYPRLMQFDWWEIQSNCMFTASN